MKEFRKIKSLKFLYEINSDGSIVRNTKSKRVLTQFVRYGYNTVNVRFNNKTTRRFVHCLVAEAWIGDRPDGMTDINHKDFNRFNNDYHNLEYMTHSDNVRYSYINDHDARNKIDNARISAVDKMKKKVIIVGLDKEFASVMDCAHFIKDSQGVIGSYQTVMKHISEVITGKRRLAYNHSYSFI
jgi:hypothetical protein